jgi:alkyl hydroperoxide reductase subunit AhpC
MVVITYGETEVEVERADWRSGNLWLPLPDLLSSVGWEVKPEGVCAGEACVPLPAGASWWDDTHFNLSAFARHIGLAEAIDPGRDIAAYVVPGEGRPSDSVEAPDFTLPDLDGNLHSLSDHRGEKVVLFTWGSFCGCRFDLPGWQAIYDELKSEGLTVIAVAEDAGGAATTAPWIRPSSMEDQYPQPVRDLMGWADETWSKAAPPQYPCLIDERHEVSRLYGMVNVPSAVWIDEEGRIVRPPEPAGVTEAFKTLDLATFSMPAPAVESGARHRKRYVDALRDWVRRGSDSPAVVNADEITRRMGGAAKWGDPAKAAAHFRIAEALYRRKDPEAAQEHFAAAARLWPENWAYQRQARQLSDPDAVGELDAGPEFWKSLETRGPGSFYPALDLPDSA